MPPLPHDPTALGDDRAVADASGRLGSRLAGKWHLDALLGLGGTSAVYAATHRNGLRGAVKVLSAAYSRDTEMHQRFLREGYIANKVDHPGAVRVLDDDVAEDGCAYLVMELLEGDALDEWAARRGGRVGTQEVLWLAWHVLDVLAAAHAKGIVHRDVKPDNVFLTREGVVKVLDFGLACLFEQAEIGHSVTRTGRLMGTPAFMAPEQARGRWALVDAQSDLWSVGATMFSLLTGRFVHGDQETPAEMMAATFTKPAPSLATLLPSAPAPVVQIVDCALEREKSKRFLDARSMQAAIAAAHHLVYGGPLPAERAPTSAPPLPSGRPSNDAIFSFTSSSPRRSVVPLGEQPTLSFAPPSPVQSAPPTTPRKKTRTLLAAAAAAAAAFAATTAGLTIHGRLPQRGVQAGAPSVEITAVPGAIDPTPSARADLETAPSADLATAAPSAELAPRPDAGPTPTGTRRPARGIGGKAVVHYGPPPVTAFPTTTAASEPTRSVSPSLFDRRH
jgi:serine/threonine-protein kinase